MLNQKSVLARLLANENITVQQGNYPTAFFDVVQRVLGLPLWKELDKDVYDLLVGHEVSHALFTPANFFELNDPKLPKSWYNVIEDARIEKLILRKYPGLVANFKRGYARLIADKDIFGLANTDVNAMALIDRLNVLAKGRGVVEVEFSKEEQPFVERMMRLETYEDVLALVRDLAKFAEEQGEEENDANTDNQDVKFTEEGEEGEGQPMPADESEDETEEESEEKTGGQDSEETSDDTEETSDTTEEEDEGGTPQQANVQPQTPDSSDPLAESKTDKNFMENRKDLVEDSNETIYAEGLTKKHADAVTIGYKELAESRKGWSAELAEKKEQAPWRFSNVNLEFPEDDYVAFIKETKQVVNLMVKEFEMRKAAYVSRRARQSQKGTLDVNKLHSYKYDDQLFKQVTQLADGKNHGMMMLVDYSGSMSTVLPSVLRQLIALMMFCRRVNIPFDVYAFTTVRTKEVNQRMRDAISGLSNVTRLDSEALSLVQLGHSALKNRDFEEAIRALYHRSKEEYQHSPYEALGSTPLIEAISAMVHKIKEFRNKNRVEVMNFVTLTDGDANNMHVRYGDDMPSKQYGIPAKTVKVNIDGDIVELEMHGYNRYKSVSHVGELLKLLRKKGVNCVNFFIAQRPNHLKYELQRCFDWNSTAVDTARKSVRKEGCAVIDDCFGYNRRFIMTHNEALEGEIEEVVVSDKMTPAGIAKAFNKSNSSKKKSRIVTKKFAEIVA